MNVPRVRDRVGVLVQPLVTAGRAEDIAVDARHRRRDPVGRGAAHVILASRHPPPVVGQVEGGRAVADAVGGAEAREEGGVGRAADGLPVGEDPGDALHHARHGGPGVVDHRANGAYDIGQSQDFSGGRVVLGEKSLRDEGGHGLVLSAGPEGIPRGVDGTVGTLIADLAQFDDGEAVLLVALRLRQSARLFEGVVPPVVQRDAAVGESGVADDVPEDGFAEDGAALNRRCHPGACTAAGEQRARGQQDQLGVPHLGPPVPGSAWRRRPPRC